jgi:hypothetical protein
MSVIPELWRLKQKDSKFKARLRRRVERREEERKETNKDNKIKRNKYPA